MFGSNIFKNLELIFEKKNEENMTKKSQNSKPKSHKPFNFNRKIKIQKPKTTFNKLKVENLKAKVFLSRSEAKS